MNEENIISILKESDELLNSLTINFFLSVKSAIQLEVYNKLSDMCKKLEQTLSASQANNFDKLSNRIFGQINIYKASMFELNTYLLLKQNKMREAFDELVFAQDALYMAKSSDDVFNCKEIHGWEDKLLSIEKTLFPKQLFVSTGCLVKKSICSVCNNDYGTCRHIKGKVYNGVFCGEIIKDMELLEISVVENPASKHCRAYIFQEGNEVVDLITRERKQAKESIKT